MEYEVEGPRPRGRPKRTWREVVKEDCQACKLNKEDAMDRCKWRKVIKDVRWPGWVWVGECFFWYRPTRVVPDQRLLNGCVCVCVCVPTAVWDWLCENLYFQPFSVKTESKSYIRPRQNNLLFCSACKYPVSFCCVVNTNNVCVHLVTVYITAGFPLVMSPFLQCYRIYSTCYCSIPVTAVPIPVSTAVISQKFSPLPRFS